ncbi:unnamed protein product [Brassica napus]|uniref:H/ACA ribonucleoprotein complex subunit n=1 Tax=Brassica napus TaxID=3708 RepID=A0A816J9H6_BRANA|nr:unnamed protein product [Brassica napus]
MLLYGGSTNLQRKFSSLCYDKVSSLVITKVATFLHACEGDAVTKLCQEKISHFNAPIYLQNKTQIGKIDEIFGPINESLFSVKMMEGTVATSYAQGDKFYIDPGTICGRSWWERTEEAEALQVVGEAEALLLVVAEVEVLRGAVEDSPEAEGEHSSNLYSLSL